MQGFATIHPDDRPIIEALTSEIPGFRRINKFVWATRGYQLDESGHVADLSLHNIQWQPKWAEYLKQLTKLRNLSLSICRISNVGPLASLKALTQLDLNYNQISDVGPLTSLKVLTELYLNGNQISDVGPLASLKALTALDLSHNKISDAGPLASLVRLEFLLLDNNPLPLPRSLRNKDISPYIWVEFIRGEPRWVSKLVVVGEGGTGKTSLLRRLRGQGFKADEDTTHGIQLDRISLAHPENRETMTLFTWDFGGQQIYHATHQFFLTEGALILLVWNARLGYGQGRVAYWLENIRSRAPEAPVLLVATHCDQRRPDIPLRDLQARFPKLQGQVAISSRDDKGFDDLKQSIAKAAATLPLMGQRWPKSWLKAAEALKFDGARPGLFRRLLGQKAQTPAYLEAARIQQLLEGAGLGGYSRNDLARRLHELGEILWFLDEPELRDHAVLDPQWVTEAISQVLESDEVEARQGVLSHKHLRKLWHDIEPEARDHLLQLMERFDLSYRIPSERDRCLVVELLPYEPPDYEPTWEALAGQPEIRLHLHLKTSVPPGIPTWFIARMHGFSTNQHWRHGALLADREHHGLIRAEIERRTVELAVRGPNPWPFFARLRDGLYETLERYPGLEMDQLIPCPGAGHDACAEFFELNQVETAYAAGEDKLPCRVLHWVDVAQLLFGRPTREARRAGSTLQAETATRAPAEHLIYGQPRIEDQLREIIEEVEARSEARNEARHDQLLVRFDEQSALLQRQFLRQYRLIQGITELSVPNVFTLAPSLGGWLPEKLAGQKVQLQLYCQHPGGWHPTDDSGRYEIQLDPQWLHTLKPLVGELNKILKFVMPVVLPGLSLADADAAKLLKNDLAMMKGLSTCLDQLDTQLAKTHDPREVYRDARRAEGAELRELRALLENLDPKQTWGGLGVHYAPEGEILWLCPNHRTRR